jgi:hypothetical protein
MTISELQRSLDERDDIEHYNRQYRPSDEQVGYAIALQLNGELAFARLFGHQTPTYVA